MTDAQLLGIAEDASPKQIKDAWHVLALRVHPDAGGDPKVFIEYYSAYQRMLNAPCAMCKATGEVGLLQGFHMMMAPCPRCRVQ